MSGFYFFTGITIIKYLRYNKPLLMMNLHLIVLMKRNLRYQVKSEKNHGFRR